MLTNVIITSQNTTQSILIGKNFPGFRVIVMDIDQDEIVAEVGGTNIKMGGDIMVLQKNTDSESEIFASSITDNSYIKKRKNVYCFYYDGKLGKRKYKLKRKEYSSDIDKIRYGIYKMHYRIKWEKTVEQVRKEFDEYKLDPLSFVEKNSNYPQY